MNDLNIDAIVDRIVERLAEKIVPTSWLSTKAAAHHLGVSTQFLEIARHRGEGPPFVRVNRAIRYSRAELDKWLADDRRVRKGRRQ
jgi:hypothetical protein